VLVNSSAIRPGIQHCQERDTSGGPPSAIGRRPAGLAHLDVKGTEQGLDVCDHGLDLDDDQHSCRCVKGHEVNSSAIAEMVEADLGIGAPSVGNQEATQCLSDC
jgi:hypothetical protein